MVSWRGEPLPTPNGSPLGFGTTGELMALCISAAKRGASDIILQTGQPVLVCIDGELHALTRSWLSPARSEMTAVMLAAGNRSVIARLNSGQDFDASAHFEDPTERDSNGDPVRYRFRVNITAHDYEGAVGLQCVLRHIRSAPPSLQDVQLEPEIVAESTPAQGLVLLVGETGSGKTSTTAALKRNILEGNTPIAGNLVTFEAPIEFLFGDIPSRTCTIAQSEVPRHVSTFAAGIRGALRRNPALIEVQELRDTETISAAVEACSTGHPVYATAHANSVAHVLRRLCLLFPGDLQAPAFYDLLASTHLIVSQVLVPRAGGGRVCLREWQVLTEDVRRILETTGPNGSIEALRRRIQKCEDGRSMQETVRQHLAAQTITPETAARVLHRYGYRDEARDLSVGVTYARGHLSPSNSSFLQERAERSAPIMNGEFFEPTGGLVQNAPHPS